MTLQERIDRTDKCPYNFSCLWNSESAKCDDCAVVCSAGADRLILSGRAPPACPYRERREGRETCSCEVRYELYQGRCRSAGNQAGLLITNAADIIINTNTWLEELTGMKRDDIIGASIRSVMPAALICNLFPLYDKARVRLRSERFDRVPAATPEGRRILISGWLIPATVDGRLDRMICTLGDAT